MKTVFIVVGKTKEKAIIQLTNEYIKRIKRYIPFEYIELPELANTKSLTFDLQKEKEGEKILSVIKPSDYLVLLDEHGAKYRSIDFAKFMQKQQNSSVKRLVFLVGGPYGFSKEVYQRSNHKISLSDMTFSHQMIRIFFTEQIYRALTIIKGEPYHHE